MTDLDPSLADLNRHVVVGEQRSVARHGTKVVRAGFLERHIHGPFVVRRRFRNQVRGDVRLGAPIRNRVAGKWVIPATRALRQPGGEFAGVIVAGVDPRYFERVWTLEDEIAGLSIALAA